MNLTKDDLKTIMPLASAGSLDRFCEPINSTLTKYLINTPARIAAFLAQIAHESGQLIYTRELASGLAYEGRKDLGNTQPGDGKKFKGRGLIQITGRHNYEILSMVLGIDFIANPELLEGAVYATESAGWFWQTKGLNEIADRGDFRLITKRINGGYNGLPEREEFYERAKKILKA